jgi:hypothetical protein
MENNLALIAVEILFLLLPEALEGNKRKRLQRKAGKRITTIRMPFAPKFKKALFKI